jgi:hypothetical protein
MAVVATALSGAPAHAQTTTTACAYPYNACPTTTTAAPGRPTLSVGAEVVVAGDQFDARGCVYDPGTRVQFGFGAEAMPDGLAGADGCAASHFTVPNVASGVYDVCIVASGFETVCHPVRVQAARFERARGALSDPGSAVRSLASTGLGVMGLVGVAVLLLIAGALFRGRGRRLHHRSR